MRRRIKVRRKQVGELSHQADASIDRLFLKRLDRIMPVGRFMAGWIALVVITGVALVVQNRNLGNYYEVLKPAAGGVRTEGVLGSFTTANPLYATNRVDSTVAKLVFSSLFAYNTRNELEGDLAESWQVSENQTEYTVVLKDNLKWQDGQPLTADDVVFTYQTIQNPDTQSPLFGSWQNITVTSPNPKTIVFTLANPLSSFQYSLTNGIVPKHKLKDTLPASLRTTSFNTVSPVGSGPFVWKQVEVIGSSQKTREERVSLTASSTYHKGKPKIDGFVVRSFHDTDHMIDEFKERRINAMVGLTELPTDLEKDDTVVPYDFRMAASVMTFFKTSNGVLQDIAVRQALTRATDQSAVLEAVGYPAIPVTQPFLRGQLGSDASVQQDSFDLALAKQTLHDAGWTEGVNGIRVKDGVPLSFALYARNTPEFVRVSSVLQKQWKQVGADVKVLVQEDGEFDTTVSSHSYDALLYGLTIGPDPDVYPYWHSSQADVRSMSRLNFSEYKSKVADEAIEAGRTRFDPALRTVKYKPFLDAWKKDAPAVGLYQPRFLYISRGQVYNLQTHTLSSQTSRLYNVQNWMIRRERVVE